MGRFADSGPRFFAQKEHSVGMAVGTAGWRIRTAILAGAALLDDKRITVVAESEDKSGRLVLIVGIDQP